MTNSYFAHVVDLTGNIVTSTISLTGNIAIGGGLIGRRYDGPYTVTPTQETQILNTKDFIMSDNVTVEPIPSNYGLITWNGSFIKVS